MELDLLDGPSLTPAAIALNRRGIGDRPDLLRVARSVNATSASPRHKNSNIYYRDNGAILASPQGVGGNSMGAETFGIGTSKITVERWGRGAPITLLHGENGPRGLRPLVDRLSRHFEVHVPYLAGWAGTVRGSHVQTVRDIALVAQEYIESLETPVPLVGISFGGWVAAEIATTSPRLISSLVLVSPIGIKIGGREDRDFADLYVLKAADREALYYASSGPQNWNPDSNADLFLEKAIADDAVARFCWQPYMHDPGLKERLRRICASTILLCGEQDHFVLNSTYYREYAKLIPGAKHEAIAGAGHRVEEEQPELVAQHAVTFISGS